MNANDSTRARLWIALLQNLRAGRSSMATVDKLPFGAAEHLADLAADAGFIAAYDQADDGTWRVRATRIA